MISSRAEPEMVRRALRAPAIAFAMEADVPHDDAWLSDRERAVLRRLTIEKRRRDWRLGRWTARCAARRVHGDQCFEVMAASDGAPELHVNGSVAGTLSLSHSNGVGMAVVCPDARAVGCDIERIERRSAEFVNLYFTPGEIACVEAAADERAMLANVIWSAKESVLKAARVGLRRNTRDVEIALSPGGRRGWHVFTGTLDGVAWRGVWRVCDRFVHTLVVSGVGYLDLDTTPTR